MQNTRRFRVWAALGLCGLASVMPLSGSFDESFDYQPFAQALAAHVNDRGLVDYKELKLHSEELDRYIHRIGDLAPQVYEAWDNNQKIAFWINAYNGLTLKAILDHYPIKAGFLSSFVYPSNSIRQIDGVWTDLKFKVMGEELTLDHIEHQILRKKFQEPRVHMALVCAALSCPPLRSEPYTGEKLDSQLEDQTDKFLRRENSFKVRRAARGQGSVELSSIFDWFGGDFVAKFGTETEFKDKEASQRAVLNFILPHVPEADRQYLKSGDYSISYTKYDWTLNEQN